MEVLTRKKRAATAAQRWKDAYYKKERWHKSNPRVNFKQVYHKWSALGPTPDPDKIDEIHNGGWTSIRCHECQNDSPQVVVQLGEPPDYDSSTACICLPCLEKAVAMAIDAI